MRTLWLVLFVLMLVPAAATAQGYVEGPTKVVFDHPDHAATASYELGYFALPIVNGACNQTGTPAEQATQVAPFAKPATTTGVGMEAALGAKPIGCYVAKLRALNAEGWASDWSPVSNPFGLRAAAPGNVRAVK
jgi:hypothetical protein